MPPVDICLYHVGNDPESHGWIVDALAQRPGVVVLHELVLHHLIAGITIGRGNGRGTSTRWSAASVSPVGCSGWECSTTCCRCCGRLSRAVPSHRYGARSCGAGPDLHSRFVERQVRAAHYAGPIWRIPHPAWPQPAPEPAALAGDPLIGCFGHQNMNKRIPQLLEAFSLLRRHRPGARLLLVGAPAERFDLDRRLERLGLGGEALIRESYVSEERLMALMAACDVLVNLRSPTMGETSGSVIRALSLGKAVLVSDVGWFSELPDGVALRVPVDTFEVATLAAALELAAERAGELGAAARAYVSAEHALDRVADAYVAALEEAAGAPPSAMPCCYGSPRPPSMRASTTPPGSCGSRATPGCGERVRRAEAAWGDAPRGRLAQRARGRVGGRAGRTRPSHCRPLDHGR